VRFSGYHIPTGSYIFSDFRLGTPILFFGKFGIVTINSPHQPQQILEELLEKCYYNVSEPEKILDRVIPSRNYYVITSSYQSGTGLLDPTDFTFKPASKNFQEEFSKQLKFNKIYSSQYFNVFHRNEYM